MAPVLLLTLSEEGVSGLRDVLVCLNKFNEEVCLEARKDQVYTPPLYILHSMSPLPVLDAHGLRVNVSFASGIRR